MVALKFALLALAAAGGEAIKRKKTSEAPPEPSFSDYVSIYTSLTLVPVMPSNADPYQPYPDTQGVNQGGAQMTITATNTVYVEASPVTVTVTESTYFTQYITVEPPIQQCIGSAPVPSPPDTQPATQIMPNDSQQPMYPQTTAVPSPASGDGSIGGGSGSSSGGGSDDSGGSGADDDTTTSSTKRHHHSTTVSATSSSYVPQFHSTTSSRRRGLFG